jgi:acyl carrier protein
LIADVLSAKMSSRKTLEVLHAIAEVCFGVAIIDGVALGSQLEEPGKAQNLSAAWQKELNVVITTEEIASAGSLLSLSESVESRLAKDPNGRSLVDVYAAVEQLTREELSHSINYHWYAAWQGDVLNNTDSLDDVEIVLRMEDTFGFSISDRDAQEMRTIGQTVRYLWRRSCEQQRFTLRECSDLVCEKAFIFHELRRLLIMRGGVPRNTVRLDVRLGDLLPSRNRQFWREIERIFGVDLPRSNLLTLSVGLEKRTTINELVALIAR